MGVKRFFQIHPLAFLLLSLWIAGCGARLQDPSSDTEVLLDNTDFNTVLEIVDVSEPTKQVKVSSTSLPSKPEYYSSITVWKQFVLATTAYGVHLLDVANPATPRLLWNLPIATLSGKAVIFKDYAFFPTLKGLYVLDLKNPLEPQWAFHAGHKGEEIRSHLIDLKIKGNYAYTYDVHQYLHVFDISQPQQPKLVNSYVVEFPSFFILFRALGEEAILQPTKIDRDLFSDRISFVICNGLGGRQRGLRPAFSSQLADWNNLLELSIDGKVKAQISPQYLCWVHLHDDAPQLWVLLSKGNRIYPLDIIPAYIKYQYNSGIKKRPKPGDVTDVIKVNRFTLYVISQDKWMKTVKMDQGEWGRATNFQLSADRIYILRENGVLFIAVLSTTEGLNGLGFLENLSQSWQHLTVDKNFVYLLSHQETPWRGN